MINVIIFSHCKLIQFALQKMTEDNLEKNRIPKDTVEMIPCSEFTELMTLLTLGNDVIFLFDIDGVSQQERRAVFDLVHKRFNSDMLMVLYAPAMTRLVFNPAQQPKNIVTKFTSLHELEHRLSLLLINKYAAMVSRDADSPPAPYSANKGLTDRQQEVLKLIMLGMNNRAISVHMGISDKTVSSHRKGIYKKYYVDNVVGLYHKIHHIG